MTGAGVPANEVERLAAVRRYNVLDTPPDGAFDRITALAARLFDVPISIVSIVDTDRIWFKSHHGIDVEEIGRDPGLCASAILQNEPWLLSDAASDPRALANPLVAGEFGLRFYAVVPLATSDGYNLGTLCVIDRQPRHLAADEIQTLEDLSRLVMDELELRLSARRTVALEAELRHHAEAVARTLQHSLLPPSLPAVSGLDVAARYHVANLDEVGGDFYDLIDTQNGCAIIVGDACGKGVSAAALTGTARWALRTLTLEPWTPAQALSRLNLVLRCADETADQYCTIALAAVDARPGNGATVTLSLGGHPFPLVRRGDGAVERLGWTAPVVGWFDDASFSEFTTELSPGDVVVMYTDGLFEAVGGHTSSDDKMLAALLAPLSGMSAGEVADAIDAAIGGDVLRDDAAFVVFKAV